MPYVEWSKLVDLQLRTKQFALRIINLVNCLPKNKITGVIGKQLLRSATSVGANYRSSCLARSKPDFIAKLHIVEEEVDESLYWLELLVEAKIISKQRIEKLIEEAHQILAMTISSLKTAKRKI